MGTLPVFVGLDYHERSIQVCVMNLQGELLVNRAVGNDWQDLARAVSPVGAVQKVGIEACCGAADLSQQLIDRLNWDVSLGHPAYVAKMKASPDKTDYSDSRLLADLTRVGYLPRVWLAPLYIRELRQLVNHRQSLVNHGRSLRLQVGALLREHRVTLDRQVGSRWTKAWVASVRDNAQFSNHGRWIANNLLDEIEHMQRKIAEVEGRLREATEGDAVVSKLMAQPGVGEVTAWVLRAFIGDFSRFKTAKQLARYCGLSPRNASTGKKIADAGLIDACNKTLRMILVQMAHRLIRTDDYWSEQARKLKARGKPACVIVGAVGNHWVRRLHHVMKADQATKTDQVKDGNPTVVDVQGAGKTNKANKAKKVKTKK